MKWTKEADEAMAKVPFFVRKRVRKRVEEEAARQGDGEVRMHHVRVCQRRFMEKMEEEVKGYQVEACFGQSGCPNRAVTTNEFSARVEEHLAGRKFKSFLKERVKGSLKMHHEFRVSIADCPNACSRPQIADLGLIGARKPMVSNMPCNHCGACVEVCRENAIRLEADRPAVDFSKCLACGQCIASCPTGTFQEGEKGYRILAGGKLGRHPRLAREFPGIYSPEETLKVVERCLDHYQKNCTRGERFGEILERTGINQIIDREPQTDDRR